MVQWLAHYTFYVGRRVRFSLAIQILINNMNNCKGCGTPVKNKYCSVSCQNTVRSRNFKEVYYLNPKLCLTCLLAIPFEQRRNNFCNHSCAAATTNKNRIKLSDHKIYVKPKKHTVSKLTIKTLNKTKIFELSKNWQSARSTIRKDACRVYKQSGKEYKCNVCGYSNHVEIAHIKAVSEFDNESTLLEINDINNLVALCPNHHWEFDNKKI